MWKYLFKHYWEPKVMSPSTRVEGRESGVKTVGRRRMLPGPPCSRLHDHICSALTGTARIRSITEVVV